MYNEIGNIFRTEKKKEVCVCAEIVWRISLRNLDQTLISPSSKIGLSWNLVSMFYSCSSWIWAVGLSIGIPYGEFCSSEQGWAENKGENSSITQVSSKRDISLICGPIGLKFCQNILHSSFYNLSVRLLIRIFCREIYSSNWASKFVLFYLLFHLLIFHIIGHDCYMDGIIKYIHAMMIVQWLIKFYGIIIISDEI